LPARLFALHAIEKMQALSLSPASAISEQLNNDSLIEPPVSKDKLNNPAFKFLLCATALERGTYLLDWLIMFVGIAAGSARNF
jgi:hypothetical protein